MLYTEDVLDEVRQERHRQDEKWGGPEHDDTHDGSDWHSFIQERCYVAEFEKAAERRRRLMEIAALAVAAIESMDRKNWL